MTSFFNLVDRMQLKQDLVDIVAGGQCGLFPSRQCVDLHTVVAAATQFAIDGSMLSSLTWEKQL
jgi:hypothetical protein